MQVRGGGGGGGEIASMNESRITEFPDIFRVQKSRDTIERDVQELQIN